MIACLTSIVHKTRNEHGILITAVRQQSNCNPEQYLRSTILVSLHIWPVLHKLQCRAQFSWSPELHGPQFRKAATLLYDLRSSQQIYSLTTHGTARITVWRCSDTVMRFLGYAVHLYVIHVLHCMNSSLIVRTTLLYNLRFLHSTCVDCVRNQYYCNIAPVKLRRYCMSRNFGSLIFLTALYSWYYL